jgi:hypothetical protein
MKTIFHILIVVVTGMLFGSVINKLGSIWFSQTGNVNSILATAVNTGLNPTTVDLGVIQFTLGLVFKFNIATVTGIFIAAVIYKQIIK